MDRMWGCLRQQRPRRAANEGDGYGWKALQEGRGVGATASSHLHLLVAVLCSGLCRLLLLGHLRRLVLLLSWLLSLWLLVGKRELRLGGVRRVQEANVRQWHGLVVRLQEIVVARCEGRRERERLAPSKCK